MKRLKQPRSRRHSHRTTSTRKKTVSAKTQRAPVVKAPDESEGENALRRARVLVVKSIGRCERLSLQVDEAFGGQLFFPDIRPDAPENVRRFNAYISRQWEISKLLLNALRLWQISYGADSPEGWTRLLIEDALGRAGWPGFNIAPHPPASKKKQQQPASSRRRGFTKQSH